MPVLQLLSFLSDKGQTNRWVILPTEIRFKEIKRLKSLQVKGEAYLEPKQASVMELFCEYTERLLFLQ